VKLAHFATRAIFYVPGGTKIEYTVAKYTMRRVQSLRRVVFGVPHTFANYELRNIDIYEDEKKRYDRMDKDDSQLEIIYDKKERTLTENLYKDGMIRTCRVYYDDMLMSEANYSRPMMRHGEQRMFYKKGGLKLVSHFKNGKPSGPEIEYNEDGSLKRCIIYKYDGAIRIDTKRAGEMEYLTHKEIKSDYWMF
jgi:antitoxin component YwqK of YwqJK toxin-antitoxin module